MTSISKNVYINKLADMVHKYNNTYHNKENMKPVDVKSSTYIDCGVKNSDIDIKFKVGDHVRISKQKSTFAKGYAPNSSEEIFLIKTVKSTML